MAGRATYPRLIFALWVAELSGAYGLSMIYAAMKPLIALFGDPVAVSWLVSVFLLVGAAAAAVTARLGDLFGRQRILLAVLLISGIGLLLGATTKVYALILIARGLQGLTFAILPLCIGLLRENVESERLPFSIALVLSAVTAGAGGAMVLGGWITDTFGWNGLFAFGVVMQGLSWILVRLFVPPSVPVLQTAKIDLPSAFLCMPAIAGLLFVISSLRSNSLHDPLIAGILILSLVLMAAWIWRSVRLTDPLINLRLFAQREVLIVNVIYMLVAFGPFQVNFLFSALLQAPEWTGTGLGQSASIAGLVILPSILLALPAGPLGGLAIQRFGSRDVIIGSGLLTAAGWASAWIYHDSVASVLVNLCIISFGTAILYTAGPTALVSAVPSNRTSEATGMMTVLRTFATAAGAVMVAQLLASGTVHDAAKDAGYYPNALAYSVTMAVIALIALLIGLAARLLPQGPPIKNTNVH